MKDTFHRYFAFLPVLYLFVAVFVARSKVQFVYIAAAMLVAVVLAMHIHHKQKPLTFLAQWMAVLASIGISAAVILSIEKIELLKEPNHVASCSLSPVVACSPVIASQQASAFGFPNTFIGIFGFSIIFAAAMTILAGGAKLARAWWRTLLGGIIFAAGFCVWLIYQGVFVIEKLCLYCLLVWLVTFGLLWLIASHCVEYKHINLGKKLNTFLGYKYELITASYVAIFMVILFKWSDYWFSLF